MAQIINSYTILVRCLDLGGWLDTWFAKYGFVFSLSVWSRLYGENGPYRGIKAIITREELNQPYGMLSISAADPHFDIQYPISLIKEGIDEQIRKQLLLSAAYMVRDCLDPYEDIVLDIQGPYLPGASLGTSASVVVAVIYALSRRRLNRLQIAKAAHDTEEYIGGQSGTQDQFQAAFNLLGGANFITVDRFPRTYWKKIHLHPSIVRELESRLMTICLGPHCSSDEHRKVIAELVDSGPNDPRLEALRPLAMHAKTALLNGDFNSLGAVMQESIRAQRNLCSSIISPQAEILIDKAKEFGIYAKVNGAGGDGGSITFLAPTRNKMEQFRSVCPDYYLYYEHRLSNGVHHTR